MNEQLPPDAGKLWGGRFDQPPNELFYEFQRSFPFDRRLLTYELAVDRAWARALEKVGILTLCRRHSKRWPHSMPSPNEARRIARGWTSRLLKTCTISSSWRWSNT